MINFYKYIKVLHFIENPASIALGSRNVPNLSSIPRERVKQLQRELRVLESSVAHSCTSVGGDSMEGRVGGGGNTSTLNVEKG